MKRVSNEEFNAAYANLDNIKIINHMCRRFRHSIPSDELKQCGRIALMKCLQSHNPDYGRPFTSSLCTSVLWVCRNALRDKRAVADKQPLSFFITGEPYTKPHHRQDDLDHLRECLERLPVADRDILHNYYFANMTFKEIGKLNAYTSENARQRVATATNRLKRIFEAA